MKKSFAILALIFFAACSIQAKTKKKVPATNVSYASMNRTACFGRCPDYMIEIYSDGTAKYFGYYFVKDSGVYQKNIGVAKAQSILKEFEKYRVDTCQKHYHNQIPDLPGITIGLIYKGEEYHITNAHFGPEFLKDLAKEMDAIGKPDKSWKKIAKTAKR